MNNSIIVDTDKRYQKNIYQNGCSYQSIKSCARFRTGGGPLNPECHFARHHLPFGRQIREKRDPRVGGSAIDCWNCGMYCWLYYVSFGYCQSEITSKYPNPNNGTLLRIWKNSVFSYYRFKGKQEHKLSSTKVYSGLYWALQDTKDQST